MHAEGPYWKRVGPVCDAPGAVPILANDVPGFLRNTKISSKLQNGKTARLEQNCTVSSRADNRDGVQTCFGSKHCQQVGERRSHVFGGCAVHFEDLQAACAHVHAAGSNMPHMAAFSDFGADPIFCRPHHDFLEFEKTEKTYLVLDT